MNIDPKEWIALNQIPGMGPVTYSRLLDQGYTVTDILTRSLPDSVKLRKDTQAYLHAHSYAKLMNLAEAVITHSQKIGATVIPFDSEHYPDLLREIADPPLILWVKGDVQLLHLPQIAIVGSRKPTGAGQKTAQSFAAALAEAGFVVTSGLAQGVDSYVHQAVVSAHKPTIAVLGSGVDHIYPRMNVKLAQQICAEGGLLVSELAPGSLPKAEHFPRRNRIISGLSVGTLVVEAAIKSGSLITARLAMEQGREVFAIPGSLHNPLAKGCHALIREGAQLVESVNDICSSLTALLGFVAQTHSRSAPAETQELDAVSRELSAAPKDIDELVELTQLPLITLQQQLVEMELTGQVEKIGSRYVLL